MVHQKGTISVIAAGSRGDIQPPAMLAVALSNRGHKVRLIAPREFGGLVRQKSIDFLPLNMDVHAELLTPEGRASFHRGRNPASLIRWFYRAIERYVTETLPLMRDYVAGSDVIVGTGLMDYFAGALAQHFNKPVVHAYMQPLLPTRDFSCGMVPPPPCRLPGWMNRLEARMLIRGVWWFGRKIAKTTASILDLPPPTLAPPLLSALKSGEHFLLAYSEALLPRGSDWPENVHVTGYWFSDEASSWSPPPELVHFIESGPAPIYVGFGSMIRADLNDLATLVINAARESNYRVIVGTGWAGLRPKGSVDDLFAVESVPHDWLFPKVVAAIHHGGAGTVGACLRAGIPQIVVPLLADQFFWASLLHKRGLSPKIERCGGLTEASLSRAIETATKNGSIRSKAKEIGTEVRNDRGTINAADIVEQVMIRATS